ncbi:myosin light chain kinase A [Hydra vulgaris]|uniref:Myosin light chain kinase A n=1 Tax=Hydra vulgaris TaxID=6087 RepID=A0ABM4BXN5_HYDVU
MEFQEKYEINGFIQKGQFGSYYACINKETGSRLTVKIKSVSHYKNDGSSNAYVDLEESREIAIWRRLKHRNVLELLDIIKTPTRHYLVMECITECNLLDEIEKSTTYTERDVCFYIRQIFSVLLYFREKRIIHRNINAENIFLQRSNINEIIKIADFGLAVRLSKGQNYVSVEACGLPLFLAPETILDRPISYGVDLWSVGVLFYIMLTGNPPFWNEFLKCLYFDITTKKMNTSYSNWNNISDIAKEFLEILLEKNSLKRINVEQALNHAWFESKKKSKLHRSDVIENLKCFNAKKKLDNEIFKFQRNPSLSASSSQNYYNQNEDYENERIYRQKTVISEVNYVKLDNLRQISNISVSFHPITLRIDLNESDL